MEFLSASKLKKFRKCPFSLQEPYTANEATNFGTAVHAGIAAWFRNNDKPFLEYQKEAKKLDVKTTKDPEAAEAIEWAQNLGIDRESVLTVESDDGTANYYGKNFFEVPITEKWGIRGAMDLVHIDSDGNLNIVDWKTGQSKEDDDLQLAVYALVAWKKYGQFPSIKTMFAYVQQKITQKSVWNEQSLVSAFNYIDSVAKEYLAETSKPKSEWRQTPHKNCQYCSLKDKCEAYKAQLTQEPPKFEMEATLENLPGITDAIERLEAIAKAASNTLDDLKAKQMQIIESVGGKVNCDGRTFQVKEKVSRCDYNLSEIFLGANDIIGRPPTEICSFSSTQANALAKTLDKDKQDAFKALIEANKVVKSRSKSVAVSISKEPVEESSAE